MHTFAAAGAHHITVTFTNRYGQVQSNLTVFAISRNITAASVSYNSEQYAVGYNSVINLDVSLSTALRYYTYVGVDMGDGGRTKYNWVVVDGDVWQDVR